MDRSEIACAGLDFTGLQGHPRRFHLNAGADGRWIARQATQGNREWEILRFAPMQKQCGSISMHAGDEIGEMVAVNIHEGSASRIAGDGNPAFFR